MPRRLFLIMEHTRDAESGSNRLYIFLLSIFEKYYWDRCKIIRVDSRSLLSYYMSLTTAQMRFDPYTYLTYPKGIHTYSEL